MEIPVYPCFKIATSWNQPRCPSMDEYKENVVLIPSGLLFSHKEE
jgi:hypothetical protein